MFRDFVLDYIIRLEFKVGILFWYCFFVFVRFFSWGGVRVIYVCFVCFEELGIFCRRCID